jgi:hypothetical protein
MLDCASVKTRAPNPVWKSDVEEHDYPAAASYLSLMYAPARVRAAVARLRRAPIVEYKAKDVFRASGLSLLGVSNAHVERDLGKIRKGQPLSPILLVRDEAIGRVVVADGYHRMCALYQLDEDVRVRCKIV